MEGSIEHRTSKRVNSEGGTSSSRSIDSELWRANQPEGDRPSARPVNRSILTGISEVSLFNRS
jgi:hypothetical protein